MRVKALKNQIKLIFLYAKITLRMNHDDKNEEAFHLHLQGFICFKNVIKHLRFGSFKIQPAPNYF
jgi:hypothetical protein